MKYQVKFKPKAIKELERLSSHNRTRIISKIEAMTDNLQGDIKKLTNFFPQYRLRVGNYRVLFDIEDDTLIIYRVKNRQNAYN